MKYPILALVLIAWAAGGAAQEIPLPPEQPEAPEQAGVPDAPPALDSAALPLQGMAAGSAELEPAGPPPSEVVPPPPVTLPAPPPQSADDDTVQAPAVVSPLPTRASASVPGQWVYTAEYGWIWLPYGQSYTYVNPAGELAFMFGYYPMVGWRWVASPWVLGWGVRPYWGLGGCSHYAWYTRPWFHAGLYRPPLWHRWVGAPGYGPRAYTPVMPHGAPRPVMPRPVYVPRPAVPPRAFAPPAFHGHMGPPARGGGFWHHGGGRHR